MARGLGQPEGGGRLAALAERSGAEPGTPASLPALALAFVVASFAVGIAGNQLSREVEAKADTDALELTDDPEGMIRLQQRLAERNRKLRAVSGGVGVLVTPHGASAFALAGTLFRVAKLDPDFVCPRCQGMHCTSGIVTFCPGCGDRRDEAALRSCPRCKHDFRKDAQVTAMWHEPEPEPEPEALAGTEPHAGPDAAGTAARPPDPPPVPGSPPAGWHHDPYGRHELRWWDGTAWTAHVADGGQAGNDPYPPA